MQELSSKQRGITTRGTAIGTPEVEATRLETTADQQNTVLQRITQSKTCRPNVFLFLYRARFPCNYFLRALELTFACGFASPMRFDRGFIIGRREHINNPRVLPPTVPPSFRNIGLLIHMPREPSAPSRTADLRLRSCRKKARKTKNTAYVV